MPFAITGQLNWSGLGVHTAGTRVEMRETMVEPMAVAQRLREEGYSDVRVTEVGAGPPWHDGGLGPDETSGPR